MSEVKSEGKKVIEKGKIYNIGINEIGSSGEGIGRIEGLTIFVNGGIPQDRLRVRIIAIKKNYAVGKMIEIVKSSPHRVVLACNIANQCGGCQIMHIDYTEQLKQKRKKVQETLKRIGEIDIIVNDTIGMDNPYRYRNKAQFPIGLNNGKIEMGFFEKAHIILWI